MGSFDTVTQLSTSLSPSLPKSLLGLRETVRASYLLDDDRALDRLITAADLDQKSRADIAEFGAKLVSEVRTSAKPSLMEAFLAEYGLSTKEGLALMCLAEALLRVPDATSMDALIEDKILSGNWGNHSGESISSLVNVSTMGLQVTRAVLKEGQSQMTGTMKSMVKSLGLPVIRSAVKQVMKEMGRQFVLGEDIRSAQKNARVNEAKGYCYSYDMLGEAARTAKDAALYFQAYKHTLNVLTHQATGDVRTSPGISIKLSALHPRYEQPKRTRVIKELVPRVLELAEMAKSAGMGLNIDAEEMDRLDLSLDVITCVLASPSLQGWDGFGVVVQAYSKRAPAVIDYLYDLAAHYDRKIMVRLVKGAYWDAEVKRAQVLGLAGFPVFTEKAHSDISYIASTAKLFGMLDRIYPQFATHNAHTVAAVLHYGRGVSRSKFEFQRLHGMGESLHSVLKGWAETPCRIYAPVGVHSDLLAYLVRRLLENGANSSFVNQIVDTAIPPRQVARCPFGYRKAGGHIKAGGHSNPINTLIVSPAKLFGMGRINAKGYDDHDPTTLAHIGHVRDGFISQQWHAQPVGGTFDCKNFKDAAKTIQIFNPADRCDCVGTVLEATASDVETAFAAACADFPAWSETRKTLRADFLRTLADSFEHNTPEYMALLCREAGKTLPDAIAEIREAVDFLRYYALQAENADSEDRQPRGTIVCISPWNFPLAIFIGQIAAALVTGNCVIAKPADQTPLVAALAAQHLLDAANLVGLPHGIMHLLPGAGATLGPMLTGRVDVSGVCFTGSTATAQHINRNMADFAAIDAPLVAETGGLNAMIVDSTALPEQAVRDMVDSAFQSAGQRCSALRILYVQEDVYDRTMHMLYGAMDELVISKPWLLATDIGPVIDQSAQTNILDYCATLEAQGRLLHQVKCPHQDYYVPLSVFKVQGIKDMPREIFGPVLHVATFKAGDLTSVIDDINARGYGLTMGLHSRIDERANVVKRLARVGNLYINRNQIGAVVGSQPFGGEGLSGTGPKAGGPRYLQVFSKEKSDQRSRYLPTISPECPRLGVKEINKALKGLQANIPQNFQSIRETLFDTFGACDNDIKVYAHALLQRLHSQADDTLNMPTPVGETNILNTVAVGTLICMGPSLQAYVAGIIQARFWGNAVLIITDDQAVYHRLLPLSIAGGITILLGTTDPKVFSHITGFNALQFQAHDPLSDPLVRGLKQALAARDGKIIPIISELYMPYRYVAERHICTDTTASGGDAKLLAAS